MDYIKKNPKTTVLATIVIIAFIVYIVTVWIKPWEKANYTYPGTYRRSREPFDESEVAEIAPLGTTQLDGDIPGHLASVNDPSFMTTPSIILSTTSRGGENLSYKNITTDLRGSIPRVYGGSGSPFNQNIQLEDTNIDPDTY